MHEKTFQFDKFVKDLEERERSQKEHRELLDNQEKEWAARKLDRLYREHPLNQIIRRSEE